MTALLSVKGLAIGFPVKTATLLPGRGRVIPAVQDVSFSIAAGETLALVGESGCGKTTVGRAVAGLNKVPRGVLSFRGRDLSDLPRTDRKSTRRAIQVIFQDPFSSLDPRMTVLELLLEPLKISRLGTGQERRERVLDLIGQVGLSADALGRYPHEFSGGQRQRIAIARALAPEPQLVVADEPLSALDVSVQSQVLNLLTDLRQRNNLSYLFISHDLAAVYHLADRVAVMYLGRLVEIAERDALFENSRHPYTQGLLAAVPRIGQGRRRRALISGDLPSPLAIPSGCAFHPRCPMAKEVCRRERPELRAHADGAHLAACHFAGEAA